MKPDEKGLLNFSDEDNKNTVKTTLAKAKINTDSFDKIFNDYDDRLKDLGSNYFINDTNDFIHDFSEYLTFQSFCGNYISLQDYTHRDAPLFYKQLYLFQLIFTQIMLDHLDESPKIRKQIFDGIVKIRDYLSTNLTIRFDCLDRAYYLRETEFRRSFGPITYDESFRLDALEYLCAYNPTENPIQYIANSILPEGMKMTDEKFDSFLKHINYIYTALTNLSSDDSVTRLTLWTIPPNLDRRIGFIRDGVFCRPLFDVVEKYNSLQQDENAKIPITDLKPLPENCRIITYEEFHQLTSAQDSEHSTSDSSTPSSLKTESSSDENIIEPVKRECIKISGTTLTIFGILALALGVAAQACSLGIPNPVSIALMAAGGTLIAAGSGMLVYRVRKNNQENNQALNFEIAHNNGNAIQDNDEQNLSCNDRQPFSERIENSQEQAQNLPQNQPGNPQPNLEHQVL